jgi:hypothetical protein
LTDQGTTNTMPCSGRACACLQIDDLSGHWCSRTSVRADRESFDE